MNNKGFAPLVAAILVGALLAIAGGAWYYSTQKSLKPIALVVQSGNFSPAPTDASLAGQSVDASSPEISATGWAAYSAGVISLKVPTTWNVDQVGKSYGILSGPSPVTGNRLTLNWYKGDSASSAKSYLANYDAINTRMSSSALPPTNVKTVAVGGMDAIERYEYVVGGTFVDMSSGKPIAKRVEGGYRLIAAYVVDDGIAYGLRLGLTGNATDAGVEQPFFDEILSTIVFSSSDTAMTGPGSLSPNRATFVTNISNIATGIANVITGGSVTFSWTNAFPATSTTNFFGTSACVPQIMMYDVSHDQSFRCGDIDRQVPASGSDTVKFTANDQYPHAVKFVLNYGNGQSLSQEIWVQPADETQRINPPAL